MKPKVSKKFRGENDPIVPRKLSCLRTLLLGRHKHITYGSNNKVLLIHVRGMDPHFEEESPMALPGKLFIKCVLLMPHIPNIWRIAIYALR